MANAIATAAGYELNLEEYWQVIRRHRWIILFCAFSLGTFSWIFTWMNQPPALYSSSTSVKITQTTSMTGLLLQNLSMSSVNDMSTRLALVTSYTLMERVARHLGLVPKNMSSAKIRSNPTYMRSVLDLKRAVDAEQEGESGIINIKTTANSPEFARDMAQTVAEEFRTYNIEQKNKQVFDAKRFIQQQLILVRRRLKQAETDVQTYREKNNISVAGQGSDVMGQVVANLDQEYRRQSEHLHDLRFALTRLKKRLQQPGWDYKAVMITGKVSPYFDALNRKLVNMALLHTELSVNFTEDHPQIRDLRERAHHILASMMSELDKQASVTQQHMADLQKNQATAERKYEGVPEQLLELHRLQRAISTNEGLLTLLEKRYQEVLIKEAEKVEEVSLLRPALISKIRINPARTSQTAVAGFILGLVLGLIISLVLESMDTSIGTIDEVENFLEAPVVGFIPQLEHDEAALLFSGVEGLATSGDRLERQMRLITHFLPPSTLAESYRSMRTNLLFAQSGEHRVILITSATMKEGKSTVAANLTTVVAQQGARVLLIDADLRKPMQHKTFGISRSPGLSECLLGQLVWQDAVRSMSDVLLGDFGVDEALMTPGLDQVDIITCGSKTANPADLLAAPGMDKLLEESRAEYDMVIIDMPPLLHTTDATIVAGKVDGILLIYHIGSVARDALKRVKGSIESVGGKVLGVVLNGVRSDMSADYANYKMDRYYAYGEHEHAEEPKGWADKAQDSVQHMLGAPYRYVLDWIASRKKGRD